MISFSSVFFLFIQFFAGSAARLVCGVLCTYLCVSQQSFIAIVHVYNIAHKNIYSMHSVENKQGE